MVQQRSSLWREFHDAMKRGDLVTARRLAAVGVRQHRHVDRKHSEIWRRAFSNALYLHGCKDRALKQALLATDKQPDPYEQALSAVAVAGILVHVARYDEAFEWFGKAEQLGIGFIGDAYLWSHFFTNRALAFKRTGRYDEAMLDWDGGIKLFIEQRQCWRAALYMNNTAYLLIQQRRYKEADRRLSRALRLLNRDPHRHTLGIIADSLGYLYTLTGDHVNAHRWLKESAQIFEELPDLGQLAGTLLHFSELYEKVGNWSLARAHARRAVGIAHALKDAALENQARDRLEHIEEGARASEKAPA